MGENAARASFKIEILFDFAGVGVGCFVVYANKLMFYGKLLALVVVFSRKKFAFSKFSNFLYLNHASVRSISLYPFSLYQISIHVSKSMSGPAV